MTDGMKLGDLEKTREAVGEFIAYVRTASFDEMMLVFAQLLIAVVRIAKSMGAADQEDDRMDIGLLSQQLYVKESMEEIEKWFIGLCEKSMSVRTGNRCRRTNGLSTMYFGISMRTIATRA